MSVGVCATCETAVVNRTNVLACERCDTLYHVVCALGPKPGVQSTRFLNHKNLLFLCDRCVEAAKEEWSAAGGTTRSKEDKSMQTEVEARERSETREDKSVQTSETREKPSQGARAHRKPAVKKMVRKLAPIRIIGDSMVKKTQDYVKCKMTGSGHDSLSGAKIHDIKKKVEERVATCEDGMLVIQGGGNDLERIGTEETVKEVVEAVKAAEGKKVSVAVVGVIRRPREGDRYERMRRATNRRIQEEVLKLKIEWLREKKGNVSFIDLDGILREGMDFSADGVHLNETGNERMGRRLREWVKARSLRCVDVA